MLRVLMYHYILPADSKWPKLKGISEAAFRAQVDDLANRYEMCALPAALEYLDGTYQPKRDLCLLTFDDGLKYQLLAAQMLAVRKIEGQFLLPTSIIGGKHVLPVHKSHFLMATVGFEEYSGAFRGLMRLRRIELPIVDAAIASKQYRWDKPEVAEFKYLLNFHVGPEIRDELLAELFAQFVGDEADIARELYLNWEDVAYMRGQLRQRIGGHGHGHVSLGRVDEAAADEDAGKCWLALQTNLASKPIPFSYPFGKPGDVRCVGILKRSFGCAFTTEVGDNEPGQSRWLIRRVDPKDIKPRRRGRPLSWDVREALWRLDDGTRTVRQLASELSMSTDTVIKYRKASLEQKHTEPITPVV